MVLARYQSPQLIRWIERLLEGRFRLTINREKTRIVKMREPTGREPDFSGVHTQVRSRQMRSGIIVTST